MQSLLAKYAPVLMPLVIALLGGLQVMFADNKATWLEGWQFVALVVAAVLTWAVPLLDSKRAGLVKVGANVLGALAVVMIDLIETGTFAWNISTLLFVAVAIAQALSAQVGTGVRLDAQKQVIDSRNNPDVPTITSLDPAAEKVLLSN